MEVTFLGLGLVSGSIAHALRRAGGWTSAAWTPSGDGPRRALAAGVIDRLATSLEDAIGAADLVVLGAPPSACLDLLDRLAIARGSMARGAVVTDVASTKARIVARAEALGLRFVGGHPMAGREVAGFEAAAPDLFVGRPWVIVAGRGGPAGAAASDEEAIARVEALVRATGARPVHMDAATHDAAVAAISHLPLVASVALVEAVAGGPGEPAPDGWRAAAELAAGGWAGMTRLARGDAAMGAGIAATNEAALARALRAYGARIDEWIAALERPGGPDEAALLARFQAANDRLGDHG